MHVVRLIYKYCNHAAVLSYERWKSVAITTLEEILHVNLQWTKNNSKLTVNKKGEY